MKIIINKKYLIVCLLLMKFGLIFSQNFNELPEYDHNNFILKLESNVESTPLRQLKSELFQLSGLQIKAVNSLLNQKNKRRGRVSVLDGIYKITLENQVDDLIEVLKVIQEYPGVIYAEPIFLDKPLLIPNDPNANPNSGQQYYLSSINAYDAWDLSTSSEKIRIAILDTGVEFDHEDIGTIAENSSDPVNGIDDDGNGLIDDFRGWDFANNDNDPSSDQSDHGLRVAGISNARVGNALGMAGVGFNASLVPIKIFSSENGVSSNAYEAIIYAADQGYEVINLSWGSPNSFTQHRQDIINYAVLEKGAIIVAAAGNTPVEIDFYPASYENVLSVASTNANDQKADFSSFSRKVDISAPGKGIFSTTAGDTYQTADGTSYSSPQVAGGAALLLSKFPDWTNLQIIEKLRVTSDDINEVRGNEDFKNMLGSGRLNLLAALTSLNSKSARFTEFTFNNGVGQFAFFGDTVEIKLSLENYLSPIENLKLSITSENPDITLLEPALDLGNIDSLEIFSTSFKFILSETTLPDTDLLFKISYEGKDYSDLQFLEFKSSSDRIDFGISKSFLTTNSKAEFGHEANITGRGIGLRWDGKRILENMGLIIGLSQDSLVDNAFIDMTTLERSDDFTAQERVKLYQHPSADFYVSGIIQTSPESNVSLSIEHNYYAWNNEKEESNIILEFRITNNSIKDYDSMYVGIMPNWDINSTIANISGWNQEDSIAFAYDQSSSIYAGASLLVDTLPVFVNKIDIKDRVSKFSTTVPDQEKFTLISQSNTDSLIETDVLQTLSFLIPDLKQKESRKIAFVLTAGNNYSDLKNQISEAKIRYEKILANPRITNNVVTCIGGDIDLIPNGGGQFQFFGDPFEESLIGEGERLSLKNQRENTLLYYKKINANGIESDLFGFQVTVIPTLAAFEINPDTLFLGENNLVTFENKTELLKASFWDLGNGNFTEIESPQLAFNKVGNYKISLKAETLLGCSNTTSKQLLVVKRNDLPDIAGSVLICENGLVEIKADNSDSINVYRDESLSELMFSGSSFISEPVSSETSFYITNVNGPFESNPKEVLVLIDAFKPAYDIIPDTTSLDNSGILLFLRDSLMVSGPVWSVNNVKLAGGNRSKYSLGVEEPAELELKLEAINERGCKGSKVENLIIDNSNKPFFSNQIVCKGENILIQPDNGRYFSFYRNENDLNPVFKGKLLKMAEIKRDTFIFIRGIDDFLPGEALKVNLQVLDFDVSIKSSLSEIILDQSGFAQKITFSLSEDNQKALWSVDGFEVDFANETTLFFEEEGEYEIKASSENELGCKAEDLFVLNVSKEEIVTGLNGFVNKNEIYPNPTDGILYFGSSVKNVKIYSLSGKKLLENRNYSISLDIRKLNKGVYLCEVIQMDGSVFTTKVILTK